MQFPKRPFRTHGGAHVPHRKNTAQMESVMMPPPEQVVIPMAQHIGAPCTPTVNVGDQVSVGQVVGDSDKFVSAPIHATVSGTVSKITSVLMPSGSEVKALVIDSDGEMRPFEGIRPPKVETPEELVAAARASGLVGLGGAGFPAHVKLNIPKDKAIDTLIVNVAECEPYITADNREALENSWEVLSGIYLVKDILNIERTIIAVEKNKPEVIKVLSDIAYNDQRDPENKVRVLPLKASYPQGAEKVLIQACTGRKIGPGQLPSDVGCLVMNVTSVAFLAQYIKTGMPLVSKRITVDGSAVMEPKNVIVPLGTPISKVIEFCGGYKGEPAKILMGGPMMGLALDDDTLPVLKQNNAILAFQESDAVLPASTACIHCGRCVENCPMRLSPPDLSRAVTAKDTDRLRELGILSCMECGTCVYNCPAGRQIVQNLRLGKALVKNAERR